MADYGFWGPKEGIDTKDYLLMMEGETPTSRPQRLLGHTLTNPNFTRSDALQVVRVALQGGRIRTFTITKRAPELRAVEYSIGFPSGALHTPAMAAALRPNNRNTFYLKYLNMGDNKYDHAWVFPDATLDSPQPEGDLVTVDEESAITETSTLRSGEQIRLWRLGFEKLYTDSSADPLLGIAFRQLDDDIVPGLRFVAAGGDGASTPLVLTSEDRFANTNNPTTGLAAGQIVTDIFADGEVVVMVHADEQDPAGGTGATTGGIIVSNDGGNTWTAISGITAPLFGVTRLNDVYIAVGGTGAGAAKVYIASGNIGSWQEVTSTALSVTDALLDVDADEDAGRFYMCGENGTMYVGQISGDSVVISDISLNLPNVSTNTLNAVAVLGEDHVAVGGANGYFAESFDGGVTFSQKSVAGSTAITAIAGSAIRTVVGAGTNLYQRDILTDMEFSRVTLESGQVLTGTVMGIARGVDEALGVFNMFAAVTTAGEVVLAKPYYPGA